MGKFFSRFESAEADAAVSTWGNLATFYSLLIFLIIIPFVLIVALVWLSGILGFSAWIFAAFAGLCAYGAWRLHRRWGRFKEKIAAQGTEFNDLVREANRNGKDVEISLLNGVVTLRYRGSGLPNALPPAPSQPLALEAPFPLEAVNHEAAALPLERLREELEEFMRLRDSGVISDEEFDRIKTGLLQKMSA
jgi:hypothetical protein